MTTHVDNAAIPVNPDYYGSIQEHGLSFTLKLVS